jgi:hypothetical protein
MNKKKNKKELREAMRAVSTVASRPQELLRSLHGDMYAEGYEEGTNFSNYLEQLDPSSEHKGSNARTDAFGRLVRSAGIITNSVPARGIIAMPLSAFERDEQTKVLLPEFLARIWRRAVAPTMNRAVYLSSDSASGSPFNPFAVAPGPRFPEIAPAIPLTELIAFNTGIDSNVYKSFYLNHDIEQTRMKRVVEATEIPRAKLIGQERTIQLFKYGRALETSYETLRRMPIDLVAFHIRRIAVQTDADKVTAVLDVIINGDGNSNTSAVVYNRTTLDPSTAAGQPNDGKFTVRAWLAFKAKFKNPYALTTVLAQEGPYLDLQLLDIGNANWPLFMLAAQGGFGGFTPINPNLSAQVALGNTDEAPASKLVGLDRRTTVERVFEIGANIQEVQRYITRQTEVLTMTETEGYAILDNSGSKILNMAT